MSIVHALPEAATMVDALRWRAAHDGELRAYTIVVDGERDEVSLSFAELDNRARGIAGRLQSLGKRGDRALVLCPVSLEHLAGTFGCLYAGLVVVPAYSLDIEGQAAQLGGLIQVSGAEIGVTTQAMLPDMLAIPALKRLRWVIADEVPEDATERWNEPALELDDLALMVFTSGSTSEPKAVMISHRNLLHAGRGIVSRWNPGVGDRLVMSTPPHLAAGMITGIVYTLYSGMPVTRLPPETVSARPARWLETISRTGATISSAANFLFDLSIQAIPPDARAALDLSAVRHLGNGGESVRADTIARFEEYFAPCGLRPSTVQPGYGMSECVAAFPAPGSPLTVVTVDRVRLQQGEVIRVSEDAKNGRRLLGHGSPPSGHRLDIVDPHTRTRCQPGHVGEIWASGPAISPGYWNRPDETKAAFGARLADTGEGSFFRTGDLGFLYQDQLFITGRLKEIIIIRGRSLYPADLEAALQHSHPALRGHAAAAFALDIGGEERLGIVHEVSEPAAREGGSEIISAIRHTISVEHGVQAHTVALVPPAAIPRAGQWKIGRADCRARLLAGTLPLLALEVLDPLAARRSVPYRAPQTDTERALARIWQRVLNVPGVGIDDSFADLGGDSLLSMQVLLAAEDAGLNLRVEDIYRHGTIADLSEAIDSRAERTPARPAPNVGQALLLPRQISLLRQGTAASSWAIGLTALQATEPLDGRLLERSLQHLHFHHDALRLRCRRTRRGWTAEYASHTPPDLVISRDLRAVSGPELRRKLTTEASLLRRSLDVTDGPLLRALHVRIGSDDELVVLAAHHLVTDAYSTAILTRDLDTLYRRLAADLPPELPPPTATVQQWQEQAIAFAHSSEAIGEAGYWTAVCSTSATRFPVDFARTERRAGKDEAVRASLDERVTGKLRQLQRQGLSLPSLVQYALARALGQEIHSTTVQFWTVSHGRASVLPAVDVSRTVGFLVRGFPTQLTLPETPDELEAVRGVQAQLEQIPHQGMGYEILANHSPFEMVRRVLSRPESPVRLNYVGDMENMYAGLTVLRPAAEWDDVLARAGTWGERVPWRSRLDVLVSISGGELQLALLFHSRAYLRSSIERFADHVVEVLTRLAEL
jgi:non-ribosomal peptide synthase protein (TIGR01720 family)